MKSQASWRIVVTGGDDEFTYQIFRDGGVIKSGACSFFSFADALLDASEWIAGYAKACGGKLPSRPLWWGKE